jgi:formate hydrogenlyase subunit 4
MNFGVYRGTLKIFFTFKSFMHVCIFLCTIFKKSNIGTHRRLVTILMLVCAVVMTLIIHSTLNSSIITDNMQTNFVKLSSRKSSIRKKLL